MANEKLEKVIRAEIATIHAQIVRGKGEWSHPNYVRDSTWERWLYTVVLLRSILARAGLADNGSQ